MSTVGCVCGGECHCVTSAMEGFLDAGKGQSVEAGE